MNRKHSQSHPLLLLCTPQSICVGTNKDISLKQVIFYAGLPEFCRISIYRVQNHIIQLLSSNDDSCMFGYTLAVQGMNKSVHQKEPLTNLYNQPDNLESEAR
jgi:hypothetical protein